MCTAATYKTKDFYMGRTLDYEFSYGEEITITPRNYPFKFRYTGEDSSHYAIIGMAHVTDDYPLYYAVGLKGHDIMFSSNVTPAEDFKKADADSGLQMLKQIGNI